MECIITLSAKRHSAKLYRRTSGRKNCNRQRDCSERFVKKELTKITGEFKAFVKDIDETLYMGQFGGKDEEKKVTLKTKKSAPKDTLEGVRAEVEKCKKCMLGLSRLNPVFGVGNPKADVVFVGEGPGFQEDHTGEPFVGRSGKLLDKIFESIELSRESVYIANIVKCHPMKNPETPEARGNDRPPTPEEISTCRHYLERQIRLIAPKCIVTLGSVAAKVLLGEKRGISLLRGKWYDAPSDFFSFSNNIKILPTYHPAALLRNPNLKKDTWHDMKMLRDFLK